MEKSPETTAGKEGNPLKERIQGIYDGLAGAFGGKSQVPDYVLGQAIASQMNNNKLGQTVEGGQITGQEEAGALCGIIADCVNEFWEEDDHKADLQTIKQGFNDQAEKLQLPYRA